MLYEGHQRLDWALYMAFQTALSIHTQYRDYGPCVISSDGGPVMVKALSPWSNLVLCDLTGNECFKSFDGYDPANPDEPRTLSRRPNEAAWEALGIPALVFCPDKELDDVVVLRYAYCKGTHAPRNIRQFCILAEKLANLHREGFVHADIRVANLVFSDDGLDAHVIDSDMAVRLDEHACYPPSYAVLEERHPHARAHRPKQKVHDVYSLAYCVDKFFPQLSLKDRVQEGDLDSADALLGELRRCQDAQKQPG